MRYFLSFLLLFSALPPRVWGADSVAFTCTSLIFDAKNFNAVSNNGVIDIGKISVVPHDISWILHSSFSKSGTAKCTYRMENNSSQVLETKNFAYPENGDGHTVAQMQDKLQSFLVPLRFAGLLQFEELLSNQSLANILSSYTKLPTPSGDRYLQFKQEIPFSTTIVVTDLAEEKILYRVVVPNSQDDPKMYTDLIKDYEAKLKASGKTDDEIALLRPGYIKVMEALKAQTQILKTQHQYAQFETYTYEN